MENGEQGTGEIEKKAWDMRKGETGRHHPQLYWHPTFLMGNPIGNI
jgi:hypothetical protein